MSFILILTPEAEADIEALHSYIAEEMGIPMTANRYIDGIYATIRKLSYIGDSLAINQRLYIQSLFGPNA
jgi:plasmid stabilization system protein ParE